LAKTIKVPFLAIARDKFKRPIVANLIALGFMAAYTNIVSHKSLKDTVEDAFSASAHLDTNLKALDDGYKLGKSYLKEEQ